MVRLSGEAESRLRAELTELREVQRPSAQAAIDASRSAGDIAENPDYFVAAADAARVETRIEAVFRMLKAHDQAEGTEVRTDIVSAGCVVTVSFGGDDTERYLVGSIEERPEGLEVVTVASPLGEALLGQPVGATVSFSSPGGAAVSVAITEISAA